MEPKWLEWAKKLQAIAQNGITFASTPYERERHEAVRGIASEMMADHTGADFATIRSLFSGENGYTTPKVDVRAAVFRDDRILLVREREDGNWSLPGGWADPYHAPGEAVVKEVWEESGFRARAIKLLAVYDRDRHGHPPIPWSVYKMFFLCEITGGEAASAHETTEVGFFPEDGLPPLSLTRVTPKEITRLFEHYRHPEWPTEFD